MFPVDVRLKFCVGPPGDHEADRHVSGGLLAEPTEPLRPAGHVTRSHLDRPAFLLTGETDDRHIEGRLIEHR